jgi:hypothetical protein
MSTPLIIFLASIYILISLSLLHEGRWGLALSFFCWGVGNVGLILK